MVLFRGDRSDTFNTIHWTYELPPGAAKLICTCGGANLYAKHTHGVIWDLGGSRGCCAKCKKPFYQYLHKCAYCETIFVKNFRHPAFDHREPWCWNCLEANKPDEICTRYPAGVVQIHVRAGKVPPPSFFRKKNISTLPVLPATEEDDTVFSFKV